MPDNKRLLIFLGAFLTLTLPAIPALAVDFPDERAISIPFIQKSFVPTIDGVWTQEFEWVAAKGWYNHYDNGGEMVVKTLQDGEYIYVLLELISDEAKNDKDQAMICFDTKADGGDKPNADDYCFVVYMSGTTLVERGSSIGSFEKIPTVDGVLMTQGMSGEGSPYYTEPHASYEFRIPIDMLGPSDKYGFYVLVNDADQKSDADHKSPACGTQYDWPGEYGEQGLINDPNCAMLKPSRWGSLVAPYGTMPEFPLPMIVLTSILAAMTLILRKNLLKYVSK